MQRGFYHRASVDGVNVQHGIWTMSCRNSTNQKVLDCAEAGCPIGLGVDGSASNDGSNMIQELRQAFLLQRLRYGAERITHDVVLEWGTTGSARCLGRDDIGKIAIGSGNAEAKNVIDGDGSTGWSTAEREGESHQLVLNLEKPIQKNGEL